MANKRKTTTGIIAGVTAAALLLGGTFAWTSISQQAKNETAGVVNVGGRLHDDFDGNNKDVYVENFTDPLDGGQPIYARVKLTEYMEVGKEAGQADNPNRNAVPVVNGTDINDVKTWSTHVPSTSCADCQTGETCVIHEHWEWTMGGEGDNNGQTIFMPTFNKDKDSLAADINGTYHGTVDTDKVYYDDYVVYTTDVNGGVVNEADKEAFDGEILSVNGDAYYDDDSNADENDHENQIGVKVETETHTAKQTATAKVITMAEWLADPVPGNFWVYDEDGWAYWANPIMPGEATGLLLDGIEMYKNPGEKCYYAINVVGQFATVNDWEYFYDENNEFDGTQNALTLLDTAAKNVATVVVTNVSGETLLTPGSEYQFSANVYVDGLAKYAASDFTWSVLNTDKTPAKSTISAGTDDIATLIVDPSETAKNLIVVAKAIDSDYLGALGMTSVAVDAQAPKIDVTAQESDYVSSFDGYLQPGGTYDFSVTNGGEPVDGVTYEMRSVETGNSLDLGAITDATTFVDGVLTIDAKETTRNGYNSYFKIVEITAKDADGEVITTRRLPITASGIRLEDLVFVDEDGNSTEIGVYTAPLQVGKTYTWYVAIQDASTNVYLNEWLTLEDIGARVILDGSESYAIGTFSYDEDYNEIVTPNAAATFSADYSTITANELYPDESSLCVYILGPEVSEEYEGEIYTENTFRIVQHIKIVEEWNIDVKVDWSPEEAAVISSDGETTATLELYHVGIPAEDVVWKSTSDSITVTEDGEVSFTGTMTGDLEAYTVQACNSAGDVLTEITVYVANSEKYEFIGTSRSWNTKYIALEYLPYTPAANEWGYVDSQVCLYRAGDDLSQIYYYCDDYNPYVSDWADKFDEAYANGEMPLASEVTWGSHVTETE